MSRLVVAGLGPMLPGIVERGCRYLREMRTEGVRVALPTLHVADKPAQAAPDRTLV
jgi:hypothetical protein